MTEIKMKKGFTLVDAGFTLIEAVVCLAIGATIIGLLVPAIQSINNKRIENGEKSIPDGWMYNFVTVKHDNHLFIKSGHGIIHHPDCPCFTRTAEKGEK
jgi:prepilin-type N-terminal cleavage/methylation domain-containing protein